MDYLPPFSPPLWQLPVSGTDIFCEYGTIKLRRLSSLDQWLEVEKPMSEVKRYDFDQKVCGLKLEALRSHEMSGREPASE